MVTATVTEADAVSVCGNDVARLYVGTTDPRATIHGSDAGRARNARSVTQRCRAIRGQTNKVAFNERAIPRHVLDKDSVLGIARDNVACTRARDGRQAADSIAQRAIDEHAVVPVGRRGSASGIGADEITLNEIPC